MTGPPDERDNALLDHLGRVWDTLDPPPADLAERVSFALAVEGLAAEDLDAEVARLVTEELAGSGARASERTRTITFDAASRTVMITVVDRADGLVRLDGWLAPAAALRVELRLPAPSHARVVEADGAGRFAFDGVPRGLAQLLVHPPAGGDAPEVVTPSLVL